MREISPQQRSSAPSEFWENHSITWVANRFTKRGLFEENPARRRWRKLHSQYGEIPNPYIQ